MHILYIMILLNLRLKMLGKRKLVDYSDSDSNDSSQEDYSSKMLQPAYKRIPAASQPTKKKRLSYSSVVKDNPLTSIEEYTKNDENIKKLQRELIKAEKSEENKFKTITIDSIGGEKRFSLPEANFNRTKGKRDPKYYEMMLEIHKEKIEEKFGEKSSNLSAENGNDNSMQDLTEYEKQQVIGNRKRDRVLESSQIKSISQNDQIQFDEETYLAQKMKKEEILERKKAVIMGSGQEGTQLSSQAIAQIENDVLHGAGGAGLGNARQRSAKQLGF